MSHSAKHLRTFFSAAVIGLATFAMDPSAQAQSELIITEIHYHPNETNDPLGNQKFIEIKNVGDEAQNMTGYTFGGVGNVTFDQQVVIPAGGFMVIASNRASFRARFGLIAGPTSSGFHPGATLSGNLSQKGEKVSIVDPAMATVFSVSYWDGGDPTVGFEAEEADRPLWPKEPDRDNSDFTLVPFNPNVNPDPDDFRNWRPSIRNGGSPGADEPLPSPLVPVFINEIRTRDGANSNDAIEFFNPNATAVNIGNWFLADDVDNPKKSAIPVGTTVPAGGYLVLENGVGGFTVGLSSQGEGVFLYSADAAANLTGFVNGLYFKASGDGVTFNRYLNSVGAEQFPAGPPTLGSPNAAPNVGPVVITEIMYNPTTLAGADEFLEIKNISASTVNLFDPLRPANNWRVEGINYILPGAQPTLAAGEIALITQTTPAAFRTAHPGVPVGMKIFGPYSGSTLSNGGEEVALQRPENLDAVLLNKISYINVDVVQYDNSSPWPPQADAGGRSLVRIDPTAYGNDPINWEASLLPNGSAGVIYNYTGPSVFVNEVLSHTDLPQTDVIELFNPNPTAVNIGGWFLTDDKNTPKKFTIPTGTTIPAGGFWAVNQDNDDNLSGAPANYFGNAFQISSRGDETYLYSADAAGNLTGYRHGWQFRATTNGAVADETLGRHIDSFGREHFTRQVRSFEVNRFVPNPAGAANNPPLVGPVVFTEINAEPAAGGVEFIELKNLTDQTVLLYDATTGGNPNNNWSIDGVIFTFTGLRPALPANAIVVILPQNTDVAAFRTTHNIAPEPEVFVIGGPNGFQGALNNGGEELVLLRPDKPDIVAGQTIVPRIPVDVVNYGNSPHWPANSTGATLEKINLPGFSDDPANWAASTSAAGTPGSVPAPVEFSYSIWAQDNFTAAELANPSLSDCDGDVNGDGVANLFAYAFGYDPHTTPVGDLLPEGAIVTDSDNYLALTFRRRIIAPDLTFELEASTDLSDWSVISGVQIGAPVDNGDGTESVQIRHSNTTAAAPRQFLRVRITKS